MLVYVANIWSNLVAWIHWKLLITVVVTFLVFLFGVNPVQVLSGLFTLVAFDFALGVAVAYKQGKEINTKCAMRSPFKLLVYGAMVASGHLVDVAVGAPNMFEQGMVIFLMITEFISVLKNCGLLGFAIPQRLLNLSYEIKNEYE